MTGSFLNTLGTVSRRGQWRLRRVFRACDDRGRLDLTDTGLVDFSTADLVTVGVYPRPPFHPGWPQPWLGCEPQPVLLPLAPMAPSSSRRSASLRLCSSTAGQPRFGPASTTFGSGSRSGRRPNSSPTTPSGSSDASTRPILRRPPGRFFMPGGRP